MSTMVGNKIEELENHRQKLEHQISKMSGLDQQIQGLQDQIEQNHSLKVNLDERLDRAASQEEQHKINIKKYEQVQLQ